ncbi:hypothetical protein diail_10360 [Diaporthe ilicicola]|nr:hypothetical protein diail_10360 [Diaporthe ilicicola]
MADIPAEGQPEPGRPEPSQPTQQQKSLRARLNDPLVSGGFPMPWQTSAAPFQGSQHESVLQRPDQYQQSFASSAFNQGPDFTAYNPEDSHASAFDRTSPLSIANTSGSSPTADTTLLPGDVPRLQATMGDGATASTSKVTSHTVLDWNSALAHGIRAIAFQRSHLPIEWNPAISYWNNCYSDDDDSEDDLFFGKQ